MRGHCIICSELFVASSEISAIICGHTFHCVCLSQWTARSKTCPQCRIKLNSKSVIPKLFFDAGPDLEPEEDPDVLRNRNSHLETELLRKNKEITELQYHTIVQEEQNAVLKKDNTTSKNKLKKEQDLTASLKIQLECLCNENKRSKQMEKENTVLKNKLKEYKNMEVIMNGSDEDAKEILKSHGSGSVQMEQLAKYCGVLKSELTTISMQKQRLVTKQKNLELERSRLEKEVNRLQELEESVATMPAELLHKDRQIYLLEEKLKKAEKQVKLLTEGSTPKRLKNSFDLSCDINPSPSGNTVPFNKENDSPLLARLSVAASIAMAKDRMFHNSYVAQEIAGKAEAEAYKHFNIMNRRPTFLNNKCSSAAGSSSSKEQGYDGLGGHSRPDIFPGGSAQAKRKVKFVASYKAPRTKGSNKLGESIIID